MLLLGSLAVGHRCFTNDKEQGKRQRVGNMNINPPHGSLVPLRLGSGFAAARAAPGSAAVDASTPATAALAVLITSLLVPSNPDGCDVDILSIDFDDGEATCPMKPSLTVKAQSASRTSKEWERIEKQMQRQVAMCFLHTERQSARCRLLVLKKRKKAPIR